MAHTKPYLKKLSLSYPSHHSELAYQDYITQCQTLVKQHRLDLHEPQAEHIITANTPFELYPPQPIAASHPGKKAKYGALLIHGLFDSPFSLRDIGSQLQAHGILARGILLPGHGITPGCMLSATHQDWIQSIRYGVDSLAQEVEQVFLIGFWVDQKTAYYTFDVPYMEALWGIVKHIASENRLYKDGIGGAYRTSKAAARTAAYYGIAAKDFRQHYLPVCRNLATDNAIGKVVFATTHVIQGLRVTRRGLLQMVAAEQKRGAPAGMSSVLWDTFTGSAPYRDVFWRTLHPLFLSRFLYEIAMAAFARDGASQEGRWEQAL